MFLGISHDLWVFIAIAVGLGGIAFRVGMHFPAKRESDFSRQVWAAADIFAVLLTVVGVAKLMSPLLIAEQAQHETSIYSFGVHQKEQILSLVNKAQDQFCPAGALEPSIVPRCNAIRDMQRTLLFTTVDAISARHILNNDLPVICSQQQCEQIFADIHSKVAELLEYCQKNSCVFPKTKIHESDEIIITLGFVAIYMFITSFRLGRSGSEFARNRKAWNDKKAGKKSTEEQIAAINERLDRIDPPARGADRQDIQESETVEAS